MTTHQQVQSQLPFIGGFLVLTCQNVTAVQWTQTYTQGRHFGWNIGGVEVSTQYRGNMIIGGVILAGFYLLGGLQPPSSPPPSIIYVPAYTPLSKLLVFVKHSQKIKMLRRPFFHVLYVLMTLATKVCTPFKNGGFKNHIQNV